MSSAFIREGDSQHLNEVAPNMASLLLYLRRENGGYPVLGSKSYYSEKYQREVFEMSDGLTYALNDDQKWMIILD